MNACCLNDSPYLRHEVDEHHRGHRQHQQRKHQHDKAHTGGHAEQRLRHGRSVAKRLVAHGTGIPDFVALNPYLRAKR